MRIRRAGPGGEAVREAPSLAIRIHMLPRGQSTLLDEGAEGGVAFNVLQPLVHMDRHDKQADAYWRAVREELCGDNREAPDFLCVPGVLERLQAQDVS